LHGIKNKTTQQAFGGFRLPVKTILSSICGASIFMKHTLVNTLCHSLLWLLLIPLMLCACQDENVSCFTDTYDTVRVNFLKLDRERPRRDTLYFESVSASNGVFLDIQDTALSRISLPLNPSGNEVAFYINWREDSAAELQTDTLVLVYEREQRLVSPECGVEQRFVNLRKAGEAFDSVNVVEQEVKLFSSPVNVYTCQYEFTNLARARFLRPDTVSTEPLQINRVETTLLVSRITDELGNVILEEPDSLRRFSLPLNFNDRSTTFFFEIINTDLQTVERNVQVTYRVDTAQIFDCLPQTTISNLDTDTDDYNFADVDVVEGVLNINNDLNLEILF